MPYRQTTAVQARRHEARIKILLAAQACVAARGYSGSHMTGIARLAQVATGTLYNHFPSREELFSEVFRRIAGHELALARVSMAGDGPVKARLEKSLGEWCRRAIRSGRLAYALLAEPVEATVAGERLAFRRAYTSLFAALIDEGITAGEFPSQNANVTAASLIGVMTANTVWSVAENTMKESGKIEALTGEILGFCMAGIGGIRGLTKFTE